jgi:hypothetical protein
MFKIKKRSARGTISMQDNLHPGNHRAISSAKMVIDGEDLAQAPHSVITADVDAGAVHEPLVLDFAAMHDGYDTKGQSPPLTPPPSQKASRDQQGSWLSDEERDTTTAPPPPDFTRRGIHIPSRTRWVDPKSN